MAGFGCPTGSHDRGWVAVEEVNLTEVEIQGSNRRLVPSLLHFVFLFQGEDGIRVLTVTGVQTCALPISAAFNLRVVSREELLGELARREQEWRQEFEQILKGQEELRHRLQRLLAETDAPDRAVRDRKSVV